MKKALFIGINVLCFLIVVILAIKYQTFYKEYDLQTYNGSKKYTRKSSRVSYRILKEKRQIELIINIVKNAKENNNFVRIMVKYSVKPFSMYVFSKFEVISNLAKQGVIWELGWINQLISYMKQHNASNLIDIGCHLGTYTLIAAVHGHKVIAIDANRNHTDALIQAVKFNNFRDKVTVISNAISNKRKENTIYFSHRHAGEIRDADSTSLYKIKSILLDDLLPLIDDGKIVIKIDVEGGEINAFKGASKLFFERNVVAVFMEWSEVKVMEECYFLINFFMSRDYRPYSDFISKVQLDISNYKSWPTEAVWRKRG